MLEHQFSHEVVGLESKFFWLPLAQQKIIKKKKLDTARKHGLISTRCESG